MSADGMIEVGQCAYCQQEFSTDDLLQGEKGLICNMCLVDQDVADMSKGALKTANMTVVGAVVAAGLGTMVDCRSTSSSSVSFGGHGSRSSSRSANPIGLIGGGLAILCAVIGIVLSIRARQLGQQSKNFGVHKIVLIVLLVLIAGWSVFLILGSLPSSSSVKW